MLLSLVLLSLVATGLGIACFNGEVRLYSTSNNRPQGVVELCYNEIWRPVCFSNVNPHEASIICTQQGYSGYDAAENQSLDNCSLNGIDLLCTNGTESTVQQCDYNLLPYPCPNALVTCSKANCTDTELRLVGGATPWEGRVEVCVDGRWGTVCGEGWTNEDAGHVCTRLGYTTTNATLCSIRPDEGPITCNFTDNGLNSSKCSHTQHFGVQCNQVNTTNNNNNNTECNATSDVSTSGPQPTGDMVSASNTGSVYEVFTGLLAAVLVGVVIGWIASCLYHKTRHRRGSYTINQIARQQTIGDRESNPPNQYVTFDPNYELITSKTTAEYDTLSRKTTPQPTGSHDTSHDTLGNMNEYSLIDKNLQVHEYRTLELANEMADEAEVGGAIPPAMPREYEIPTPLPINSAGRELTDKTSKPTD